MRNIVKTLKLEALDYYKTHLSIINCLLPTKITNKEIEVLALYMYFSKSLENDKFGIATKRLIRKELNITHQGLSNYIKSLTDKKFLIQKENKEISILPLLHPEPNDQIYMLKLINVEGFTPIATI